MAGRTKGILTCLKVSATAGGAGSYTPVNQLTQVGSSLEQKNLDSTTFCSAETFTNRMTGLQTVKYTAGGFLDDYGDTTGQVLVIDNLVRGTETWFEYFHDGTNYVKSQVEVESVDIKSAPDGTVDITISAQSTGPISFGP